MVVDIRPAGSPDSIGELFEESIETPMVEVELVLDRVVWLPFCKTSDPPWFSTRSS